MSELLSKLEKFVQKDKHTKSQLENEFNEIASELLFGGCFRVNYRISNGQDAIREIHIKDVEGYFFDETIPYETENHYHDWIVYHRTHYKWDNKGNKHVFKTDYLPVGSLYLHTSGVDLTFECYGAFRASFLLRSYVIIENGNIIERNGKPIETRPTYLYDDMFQGLNPFDKSYKMRWIEETTDSEKSLVATYRQNVGFFTDYNDNGPKEPEKITKSSPSYKECLERNQGLSTQDGKGIQDTNIWRFYDAHYESFLRLKNSAQDNSL